MTSTSAVFRLEVDPPSPVTFVLENNWNQGSEMQLKESKALHSLTLRGLDPGREYDYSFRVGEITKNGTFVTAPTDDSKAPFHFLVYGDNRTDDAAHAAIVKAMTDAGGAFVLHTGDFVENGASPADWQRFFDVEAPLLRRKCIYSCVGNHELIDGAGIEYARYFGPTPLATPDGGTTPTRPEHLAGTFRWGNTRFFLINGMVGFSNTTDRAWLEKELVKADGEANLDWRIVVVHHGLWSSGPHGNNARLHDAGIASLLQSHHVDLVISGHDHIYERGWSDAGKLAYLVSGGGGAPTYKIKTTLPETRKAESVRHFVDVSVNGDALQLVATRLDGSTIERCGLKKGVAGWDCDPTPPPPARSSKCACDAIGASRLGSDRALGLAPGLAAAALALVARRRRRRLATSRAPSILRR